MANWLSFAKVYGEEGVYWEKLRYSGQLLCFLFYGFLTATWNYFLKKGIREIGDNGKCIGALAGHSKYRVIPFYTCGFRNKLGSCITSWEVHNFPRSIFILPARPGEELNNGPASCGVILVLAVGDFCFSGWAILLWKVKEADREPRRFLKVCVPGEAMLGAAPAPGWSLGAALWSGTQKEALWVFIPCYGKRGGWAGGFFGTAFASGAK